MISTCSCRINSFTQFIAGREINGLPPFEQPVIMVQLHNTRTHPRPTFLCSSHTAALIVFVLLLTALLLCRMIVIWQRCCGQHCFNCAHQELKLKTQFYTLNPFKMGNKDLMDDANVCDSQLEICPTYIYLDSKDGLSRSSHAHPLSVLLRK